MHGRKTNEGWHPVKKRITTEYIHNRDPNDHPIYLNK